MSDLATTQPLRGLKVVDFSRFAPGLFATTLLADLGADVILVEAPDAGGPDLPLYGSNRARARGEHPLFRRRRSIVVDLRHADGPDVTQRLLRAADVVVEGFRPGVADRLGIGFEVASRHSPSVVYCSITGYGQSGEDAQRAGHDINYLAASGVLALLSDGELPPQPPGNLLADMAGGGLTAAFSILAALQARSGGAGAQHLDVSMTQSLLAMIAPAVAMERVGSPDPSWGRGLLTGRAPFYRAYRTADGGFISVGAIEERFFAELCRAVGRPELAAWQFDETRWADLHRELARCFAQRTREHWERALTDTAVAPVLSATEAFRRATARDTRLEPRSCPLVAGLWSETDDLAPCSRAGQASRTILMELGFSPAEVDVFIERGVVGAIDTPSDDFL